jgi:hypothetical protein
MPSNMCLELLKGGYRSSDSGDHHYRHWTEEPGYHSQLLDPSAEGAGGSCNCQPEEHHLCSSHSR